jgi:hypothetical protein
MTRSRRWRRTCRREATLPHGRRPPGKHHRGCLRGVAISSTA